MQVIGEANVGAKVLVDGRAIGYAPNKLSVALGRHQVELERTDGTRAAQTVEITEYATVAHPLRPAF